MVFLWLPFGVTRIGLYAIAFGVGSVMDAFEQSGGAHTLACLTLVTVKPWVENALIGYRKSDDNEGVSHLALALIYPLQQYSFYCTTRCCLPLRIMALAIPYSFS